MRALVERLHGNVTVVRPEWLIPDLAGRAGFSVSAEAPRGAPAARGGADPPAPRAETVYFGDFSRLAEWQFPYASTNSC
jgi:hypothetical protein